MIWFLDSFDSIGFKVWGSRIDELANELKEDWANWEGNMCNKDDRWKKIVMVEK